MPSRDGGTVVHLSADIRVDGTNKDGATVAREIAAHLVDEIRRSGSTRNRMRIALGVA